MYKTVKPATFTLPLDVLSDLSMTAKNLGKKKTTIVAEALEMYMDYQDLKEAENRLENSDGEYLSSEEIFNKLNL